MVAGHLPWSITGTEDNLVSWTSSLLYALVYIFYHLVEVDNIGTFDIHICVIDTSDSPEEVFLRDLDLIRAYRSFSTQLYSFDTLHCICKREGFWGHFYFGEYFPQVA